MNRVYCKRRGKIIRRETKDEGDRKKWETCLYNLFSSVAYVAFPGGHFEFGYYCQEGSWSGNLWNG